MFLRLAALGGLGYAAYKYYDKNREQIDSELRRVTHPSEGDEAYDGPAGGPLSGKAKGVHAGEGPVS